jgi:putative hydrolase of the HAD superfamily
MLPVYNPLMPAASHPIQAVLFDFGKVLSKPPRPESWQRMKDVSGLSEEQLHERYWAHRDDYDSGHLTGDEYWRGIAGEGVAPESLAALKAADVDMWTDMNEPMMDWVAHLHGSGVRTGILSNMPDSMTEGICAKFDWIDRFDHTIWSHALKLRKPQREIYERAAAGLGLPAEAILFLDDKEENTRAAEEFGMQAIVYADHSGFVDEMHRRGLHHLLPASAAAQR